MARFKTSRPVFLMLDGCSSHTYGGVIRAAIANGICPIYPPPNTTAWLQPVDRNINAFFKTVYQKWLDRPLQFLYAAEDQAREDNQGNGKQQDFDAVAVRVGWQSAHAQGPASPPAPKPPRPPALPREQQLVVREARTAAALALDIANMRQLAEEDLPPELKGGLWDKMKLAPRAQKLEVMCSIAHH